MPLVSSPVLTATNITAATVRLTVSYEIRFTPAEILARLVMEEAVSVSTDYQSILTGEDLVTGSDVQVRYWSAKFPGDAVAADAPTVTRTRTMDVPRSALDVVANGERPDALVATLQLWPFAPPPAITAYSNPLIGEWGA